MTLQETFEAAESPSYEDLAKRVEFLETVMKGRENMTMFGFDGNILAVDVARKATDDFLKEKARANTLENAVIKAEEVFTLYGDLHAAKPDTEKAMRNYQLASDMREAIRNSVNRQV